MSQFDVESNAYIASSANMLVSNSYGSENLYWIQCMIHLAEIKNIKWSF